MRPGRIVGYFFWFVVSASVVLRFTSLGTTALTENEARLALGAYNLSNGNLSDVIPGATYQNITAVLFFLFGNTNFLARLLSAIAGGFIVLSPFLFSKSLGFDRALIFSFLLAISPTLFVLSRQVNSFVVTIGLFILLLWAFMSRRVFLTGLLLGIGIFCGEEFWLFALFIGFGTIYFKNEGFIKYGVEALRFLRSRFAPFVTGLGFGALIFGFGLTFNQNWLASVVSSFFELTVSFPIRDLELFFLKLLSLPLYEPMLIFIAIIVIAIKAQKSLSLPPRGFYFWLILFIILLVRQNTVLDLAIFTFFLAFWLSGQLTDLRHQEIENTREVLLMSAFVTAILFFMGLTILSTLTPDLGSNQVVLRMIVIGVTVLILIFSALLIKAGWTSGIALFGLVTGIFIFVFILNTSTFWKAGGFYAQPTFELWEKYDQKIYDQVLIEQIEEINTLNRRSEADTTVDIIGIRSSALDWTLRELQVKHIEDMLLTNLETPFVITPINVDQNGLLGDFRGQNVLWSTNNNFSTFDLYHWARWIVYREPVSNKEMIILWTNSNQFVDQQNK